MVIRYDSKLEVVYPDGQLVFTSSPKRSSFSVSSGLLSWHRYKVILEYCFAGKFSFFVLSLRKLHLRMCPGFGMATLIQVVRAANDSSLPL